MKILFLFAGLLASPPLFAHLQTPWVTVGEALRSGERLVLARVLRPARRVGAGTETEVEVLADLDGPARPGLLVIWQEAPHQHVLEPASLVLLPLSPTPAGGWRYVADTRQPIRVRSAERRLDENFARHWRKDRQPSDPLRQMDEWIALLDHSAPLARAVGFDTLTTRGPLLQPGVTSERLARLLDPILLPGMSDTDRLARLRLAEVLGAKAGALAVAERFDRLPGDRLRAAAAGVLARFPAPETRAVLDRCTLAGGSLGARCARLSAAPRTAP